MGVRFFIVFEMASVSSNVILMQSGLYSTYGYAFMWVYICRCNYACIRASMHALLYAYVRIFPIACIYKCSIFTCLAALANTHC